MDNKKAVVSGDFNEEMCVVVDHIMTTNKLPDGSKFLLAGQDTIYIKKVAQIKKKDPDTGKMKVVGMDHHYYDQEMPDLIYYRDLPVDKILE